MKNWRTAAAITVLLANFAAIVLHFDQYQAIVGFVTAPPQNSASLRLAAIAILFGEVIKNSLPLIYLLTESAKMKEQAYRMFRIVFVTYSVFNLPFWIYGFFGTMGSMTAWEVLFSILIFIAHTSCFLFFLFASREPTLRRINLKEFELVAHASKGHRLQHLVLDFLVLLPLLVDLSLASFTEGYNLTMRVLAMVLFAGSFFIYYFLCEALFGQTFGKVTTNSCVAGTKGVASWRLLMLRNLLRYIPIECLSFLFGGNWHDKASFTAVVYIGTWEKAFAEQAGSREFIPE